MKKKIAFLLCMTLGGSVLLTGCGGKKDGLAQDYSKYVELGQYTGLTIDRIITPITDEDVKAEAEAELSYSAEYNEITDRAAKDGDLVVVSYTGTIDGEEFDGGSEEDVEIELGSDSYIEGFEDALVGMNTGEEKTFDITFPDEYDGELDGKTATFTATLSTIYEVVMPEYNDEYVASISDYDTVAEYEASLKDQLEQDNETDAQAMANEDALAAVIDASTFNGYPDDLYELCKTEVAEENAVLLEEFGLDNINDLYGEDYDEESYVTEVVNEHMVVYTIAAKEKLEVTDEDYQASLENDLLYADYDSVEEYEKSIENIDSYKYSILRDKVLTFLGENNEFTDITDEDYYEDLEEQVILEGDVDEDISAEGDYAGAEAEITDEEVADGEPSTESVGEELPGETAEEAQTE